MSLLDHMCKKCDYYMPLRPEVSVTDSGAANTGAWIRSCKNCGNEEEEQKGLVMEVVIQDKASDSYKSFVNEYTKTDPRLPHVKTLTCPNIGTGPENGCPSRWGQAESDVIYIKYDKENMKFLYICNHCNTQWRSRS